MSTRKANVQPYGCRSVAELARKVGYSRVSVSSVLCGRYHGGPKLLAKLEAHLTPKAKLRVAKLKFIEAGREYAKAKKRAPSANS
jgi:hypothetical protein